MLKREQWRMRKRQLAGTSSGEELFTFLAAGLSPLSGTAASPYGSCPCDLDHNERTWIFPPLARPLKG